MLAHVVTVFVALRHGLGGSAYSHPNAQEAWSQESSGGQATFAANLLSVVALALAKCSVAMFIQRLATGGLRKVFNSCYLLVALSVVWAIGSMIGLGSQCSVRDYIADDMSSRCGGQVCSTRMRTTGLRS